MMRFPKAGLANLRQPNVTLRKLQGLFCSLALLALLAESGRLIVVRCDVNQGSSGTQMLVDEVPRLDCFSRPAIAAAILQREVERSFCDCTAAWDAQDLARIQASPTSAFGASTGASHSTRDSLKGPKHGTEAEQLAAGIDALEGLDALARRLSRELDCKLMVVYFGTRESNQVVDHYLSLLTNPSASEDLEMWARAALECSRGCGRTEEVRDALEHLIPFRPGLRGVAGLRRILEDRKWQGVKVTETTSR